MRLVLAQLATTEADVLLAGLRGRSFATLQRLGVLHEIGVIDLDFEPTPLSRLGKQLGLATIVELWREATGDELPEALRIEIQAATDEEV